MVTEEEAEALREHDRKLRDYLANADEDTVVICPPANELTPQMAEEIGLDSMIDICTECGKEVTRSNIETAATIVCLDCIAERWGVESYGAN